MSGLTEKEWDSSTASLLADEHKRRTREQWGANPCGADAAGGLEFGTREYFDAIEDFRYNVDSPWLKEAVGFDRFRNQRLLEVGFGTGTDLLQFARAGALSPASTSLPEALRSPAAGSQSMEHKASSLSEMPRASAFPMRASTSSTRSACCTIHPIPSAPSRRFIASCAPAARPS